MNKIWLLIFGIMIFCLTSNAQDIQIYDSKEVIIKSRDIQIGGTLLLPTRFSSNALVIFSSGSGQQDRDETLDGFKIFKVIAEYLAENGIASFRYDDRGIGKSTGDFVNTTIHDFSNDLVEIMNYFETSTIKEFDNFILFGHSLGGIISGDVAAQDSRVKQLVLMASPAVPLIDLILFQERQAYEQYGIERDLIESEISSHNQLMKAIALDKNTDAVLRTFELNVKNILDVHPDHKSKSKATKIKMAKDKAKEFNIVYALPSIESYLYHNPSAAISNLNIPVLALYGGKDTQVTISQNKDKLEDALLDANTTYKIKIFNEANHYFQKAVKGNRDEYDRLDRVFINGFLECISNSILGNQSIN